MYGLLIKLPHKSTVFSKLPSLLTNQNWLKHVHTYLEDTVSFFFNQRLLTLHLESFRCLQAKVGNASHTPKVLWWAGITKQFIVSTLQDLPIQDLLKHLMRHILWFFFFLSQVDRPHFSVAIFSASLFQLPRTQPKTRVNTRIKCDSVTTSKLGSFPLLFSSLYPLLPPSQGVPFPCVFFYTRDETAKQGLKPVIKHRCGVLHTDECHHERHFTEVIPANRQFERPQQQLNSVSSHSSLKRHSGEPSL